MKRKYLMIICIFVVGASLIVFLVLNSKGEKRINAETKENRLNLTFNYNEKVCISDIIKNTTDSRCLDTRTLGEKEINVITKESEHKVLNVIKYNVIDNVPPVIMGSSSKTILKGTSVDLVNSMLCGDNYDARPNCFIEGKYDVNKIGEYNLKYVAIDTSNNRSARDYKLIVKNSINKESTKSKPKKSIEELIKEHKSDNTMIGIDVSSWQGNINYDKVKNSNVEFVMIRMGYGFDKEGKIVFDNRFKENIINAKKAGLKVGLYFYSYAKTIEEARLQAKWIVDNLNGELLDLPIAFDWEIWDRFNSYDISFTTLNDIALSFFNEIEKYGYEGMIYGSASYLERIWDLKEYKTWLAHYTNKTDYSKEYFMWQLSNVGKVSGIDGDVDLNVLYKK